MKVRTLLGSPGVLSALAGGVVVITSVDLVIAYLPAIGQSRGIEPEVIGVLLGAFSLAQMVARVAIGSLAKRIGLLLLLCIGMGLAAIGILPIALSSSVWFAAIGVGVAGFGLGLGIPLTLVRLAELTPREHHGMANGVRFTGNRLAQVTVPAAVGASAGQLGPGAVLLAVTLVLMSGAAALWSRRPSHP